MPARSAFGNTRVYRSLLAETVPRQYPLRRGFLDALRAEATSANSNGTFMTGIACGGLTSAIRTIPLEIAFTQVFRRAAAMDAEKGTVSEPSRPVADAGVRRMRAFLRDIRTRRSIQGTSDQATTTTSPSKPASSSHPVHTASRCSRIGCHEHPHRFTQQRLSSRASGISSIISPRMWPSPRNIDRNRSAA